MLDENRYFEARVLPDGTIAALFRLMFTTAICTGIDWNGYANRWCFQHEEKAREQLHQLQAMDDECTGHVARR